jgi:hypothetical protein
VLWGFSRLPYPTQGNAQFSALAEDRLSDVQGSVVFSQRFYNRQMQECAQLTGREAIMAGGFTPDLD